MELVELTYLVVRLGDLLRDRLQLLGLTRARRCLEAARNQGHLGVGNPPSLLDSIELRSHFGESGQVRWYGVDLLAERHELGLQLANPALEPGQRLFDRVCSHRPLACLVRSGLV